MALLRRQIESAKYTSEQFQRLIADHGVVCSMSRSGNVWDNAAIESFFSSLKTERTARKIYRTRNEAKADVFDYIERFYNPERRYSTIGYLSLWSSSKERGVNRTGCSSKVQKADTSSRLLSTPIECVFLRNVRRSSSPGYQAHGHHSPDLLKNLPHGAPPRRAARFSL
jgi:putative transposase